MALLKSLMRTGIATKVMNEARKPKNQEKAKQLFSQAKNKISGDGSSTDGANSTRTGPTEGGPTGSAGSGGGPTRNAGSGGPTGPAGASTQDGPDPIR